VGTEYKTLDFCLRLASAGFGCHWVPGVRLVALDENAHAAPEYWQQTAALVDRWGFRAAWSPRTLNAA
jgi:hypothetical protein